MLTKIIIIAFYALFAITPLVWAPFNYELFEFNKMMFVYGLTIIIITAWALRIIREKRLILKRTPLDIPLLIFLGANILSTILSVDPHTSIWGYYTRLNGGLVSTICYTLLYFALVSNFEAKQVMGFLKATVVGGLLVALYAVPEHFGVSPSCIFLTGNVSASCWVQNVQARVFATLGQPNWLAGYLAMIVFPAIYFAIAASDKITAIRYILYAIIIYMAFTFTYSRAGALGLLGGMFIFTALQLPFIKQSFYKLTRHRKSSLELDASNKKQKKTEVYQTKPSGLWSGWRILATIILSFLFVNIIFGSSLIRFELFFKSAKPTSSLASLGTQLESGGSETGQIRLVVWKGAMEIFKHYPLFGSGIETFAYTYYNFRPMEHNYLSEWDFLYNKAHNEFLNYLATTGAIGFLSYLILVLAFIAWSIRYVISGEKHKNSVNQLLVASFLAAIISYHIQNFFGFSVVIIALLFYLFPAMAFVLTSSTKEVKLNSFTKSFQKLINQTIYRRPIYSKAMQSAIIFTAVIFSIHLINMYRADLVYTLGGRNNDQGEVGKAYNYLSEATLLRPSEPQYKSDFGYSAAAAAVALATQDATLSASLVKQADKATETALTISPKNVTFRRAAIRTYYLLAELDKSYVQKTLDAVDQTIALAPTDPKLPYHKALILNDLGKTYEAISLMEKAVVMKPDYRDAKISLSNAYFSQGKKSEAIEQLKALLKIQPNDEEIIKQLQEWEKK